MKNTYYTDDNIDEKAQEFLSTIQQTKNITFDINKSALLVLDLQEYFLNEKSHAYIPSAPPIIPNIKNLMKTFHKNQRPIIFTKHINTEENAGLMKKWWKNILHKDDKLSEFKAPLDTKNAIIIEKSQYDAFYKTDLERILKKNNIEQLVITGVMTHLCCETTARSAFVRSYQPFIPVDATATINEDFHKASLLNLSHGFAVLSLTIDIK